MERFFLPRIAPMALVIGLLPIAPAQAQTSPTFVSGVGDDMNPCSRMAPCLTWMGALAKTTAGGEIDALDPGGFGMVTINKSVTLDGGGGQVAGVLVAGSDAIDVSAGANDVVILRNLRINGMLGNGSNPNPGINGIGFVSGAVLSVENCAIFGFGGTGIAVVTSADATLNVTNTNITNTATGIDLEPSGGTLYGEVDHTTIQKGSYGIATGIGSSVVYTVTNSNILNAAVAGVSSGSAGTVLNIDYSSVSSNNTGFTTNGGLIRISRNVLYDNNVNFSISAGEIASDGTNVVAVNGATVPNGTVRRQ